MIDFVLTAASMQTASSGMRLITEVCLQERLFSDLKTSEKILKANI